MWETIPSTIRICRKISTKEAFEKELNDLKPYTSRPPASP